MKKLFIFLLAVTMSLPASATHLMGGEMTVEHHNGVLYTIHLTAYRDTIGIPFATTATFDVYDSLGVLVQTSTVPQDSSSGGLMAGYPYGVEIYYFHDTLVVPGPGKYTVRWENCCRNAAIQNLSTPLGELMHLTTTFTTFPVAFVNESTPTFLAPPVTYLPINQPWQYNSLPFDPDGDSLSWSIDTPLTAYNTQAAGWVTPSSATSAGAFTIDPITGQIDWTPDMLGNFVASILVEEYRAGAKIGEIRRDYQMIVIPDTTKGPRIGNITTFPVNSNGHKYMNLNTNSQVNITLLATDPEGDQVEFLAYGEPFNLASNPAIFETKPFNVTDVAGSFQWTPDQSQARSNPYIVVFRTRDHIFSFDETVLFFVGSFTGLNDFGSSFGDIYPNPAVNITFVPISLEKSADVSVVMYNQLGMKVASYDYGKLPAGDHLKELVIDAAPGTYLISLQIDNNVVTTKSLIIGD